MALAFLLFVGFWIVGFGFWRYRVVVRQTRELIGDRVAHALGRRTNRRVTAKIDGRNLKLLIALAEEELTALGDDLTDNPAWFEAAWGPFKQVTVTNGTESVTLEGA